jgi:asparagine synthase (glutamine-hydrolysing)
MIQRPVETLSIGFAEPRFDESPHARSVAQRFRTRHHEEIVGPDSGALLEELTWYFDEPFGDTSAIPTYLVSRLAARHVTVVLSGDGGDELFAGYDRYLVERKERRRDRIPRRLRALAGAAAARLPRHARGRRFLEHLALSGADRYLHAHTLFPDEDRTQLLTPEARAMLPRDLREDERAELAGYGGHWLSALQTNDVQRYLPLDILTKVDRATMAHSVEARVPLLDHKLVEFAATIPPEMNLGAGGTKVLMKRALAGLLPPETLRRPKRGFAVPLELWLRGPLREAVRDVLLAPTTVARGIIDRAETERLVAAHDRGRDLSLHLWTLVSLEMWCRTFLDRDGAEPPRPARASRLAAQGAA